MFVNLLIFMDIIGDLALRLTPITVLFNLSSNPRSGITDIVTMEKQIFLLEILLYISEISDDIP